MKNYKIYKKDYFFNYIEDEAAQRISGELLESLSYGELLEFDEETKKHFNLDDNFNIWDEESEEYDEKFLMYRDDLAFNYIEKQIEEMLILTKNCEYIVFNHYEIINEKDENYIYMVNKIKELKNLRFKRKLERQLISKQENKKQFSKI